MLSFENEFHDKNEKKGTCAIRMAMMYSMLVFLLQEYSMYSMLVFLLQEYSMFSMLMLLLQEY